MNKRIREIEKYGISLTTKRIRDYYVNFISTLVANDESHRNPTRDPIPLVVKDIHLTSRSLIRLLLIIV